VDTRADTNEFLSRTRAPNAARMPTANGADSSAELAAKALPPALGRVIAAYSEVPLPARACARARAHPIVRPELVSALHVDHARGLSERGRARSGRTLSARGALRRVR
jgi:hypothetical protein